MSLFPTNFYARCRERYGVPATLREADGVPPERLLQAIWLHQRLHRDRLRTTDGRSVLVLHPGFASTEGGPDFRDALLRLGDAAPCRGDIEVDLRPGGWRTHGHDRNPSFKNVILHVVWEAGRSAPTMLTAAAQGNAQSVSNVTLNPPPPVLPIGAALDAPLGELAHWLDSEAAQVWPDGLRGRCCARLSELTSEQLTRLLHEAAVARFQNKAAQHLARARVVGWEQTLWEGLFRALGYRRNTWPMQWLAERRARWGGDHPTVAELQARLLGLSGLLPAELDRAAPLTNRQVRQVWDQWWREREAFGDCILPRTTWHLHGLRPANHPQRRLALAAHWLSTGNLVERLGSWCAADIQTTALVISLLEILKVEYDEFWSWHWTLRSARLAYPQPLLGEARTTDLAVNVVLPWLWMRAAEGGNDTIRSAMETRYFAWPSAEDNAVLRLARQRLLGGGSARILCGAAAQQGLLQIVKDFCNSTNAVCEGCHFPAAVRDWPAEGAGSTPA